MQKKKTKLMLTTPCVKTTYLGSAVKQQAKYILLSKDYGRNIMYKDIENGASIYEPFLQTLSQNETRYNIITAPTEEDGLRAVQYLAEIHSVRDDCDPDEYSSAQEDNMPDVIDPEVDIEVDFSELFDDDILDDNEDEIDDAPNFPEAFFRIPVIPIAEVVNLDYNKMNMGTFGSYSYGMMNSQQRPKPWWSNCNEEAVCIIKNSDTMSVFWNQAELLTDEEIGCIKRFQNNRRVYLIIVGETISDDDFSVNTAMLDYTANCFRINNKKNLIKNYYKQLLLQQVSERGFRFSQKLDVNLLADKLSKIDKQYPCLKFEKIMDYFVHIKAHATLKADDFRSLGLEKMIRTESSLESSNVMDTKLHGMDAVKSQVKDIVQVMKYAKFREDRGLGKTDFHNVHLFVGAPGTAKTTTAKLMAKMMQEEGLINGDRFISVTGAQLKGEFVGHTAPKIHAIFERNDAIFIDEAYSLTCRAEGYGGIDSFSQEALAQLAIELEEHGKDKLVIFAGYGGRNLSKKDNLMYQFLTSNPGISSRVCSTIYFDSYTPEEMVSIVHHLANKANLNMNSDLDGKISEYFAERLGERDFGNGREARAFLENCERCVAHRITPLLKDNVSDGMLNTILPEDIENALKKAREGHREQMGEYSRKFGIA